MVKPILSDHLLSEARKKLTYWLVGGLWCRFDHQVEPENYQYNGAHALHDHYSPKTGHRLMPRATSPTKDL